MSCFTLKAQRVGALSLSAQRKDYFALTPHYLPGLELSASRLDMFWLSAEQICYVVPSISWWRDKNGVMLVDKNDAPLYYVLEDISLEGSYINDDDTVTLFDDDTQCLS